jgi:uncharacterized OB-fold protein
LAQARYLKPLPTQSAANAPFWEGLRAHEFKVRKCLDCGVLQWPPYPACRACLSERHEWAAVSGRAEVYSFSIVHRGHGAFGLETPYGVVLAKLELDGPGSVIVLGDTQGVDLDTLHIGMKLDVAFEDIPDEGVTMWRFRPAGEGAA